MAAIDDLNVAVGNCQTAANAAVTKINDLKAQVSAAVDPAQVTAAQQAVQAVADQLNAASA